MSAKRGTRGSAGSVEALLGRAMQAHQAGDLVTAQAVYAKVLRANPRNFGALYALGVSYCQQGQHARGVSFLEQALAVQPDYAEAHSNLASALNALSRHDEAVAHSERAVALDPACAEAYCNLGNALHALGRYEEAIVRHEQALVLKPALAEAYCNLGNIFHTVGRHEESIARYEQALALDPACAEAHNNLGNALHALARHDEAIVRYEQALVLKPTSADAHCNLASALNALSRHDEAAAHSERALALRPDFAQAHNNLGNTYKALARYDEAIARYEQALALKPDLAEAESNMGLVLLALGRHAEGWAPYEARWRVKGVAQLPDFQRPLWLGQEDIAGRHLLIQFEQGLGDAILMSRYVTLLEQRGVHCWIQAPPALLALLQRSFPRSHVVPFPDCPADVELRIPMMSLPLAMQTFRESDIPRVVPYLVADEQNAARWASRLDARRTRAVGLAWRGDPRYTHDHQRSISLGTMLPLLARKDVQFVALAHNLTEVESTELARHDNVIVPDTDQFSFDDLAAVVSVLDIVISVDSSPAHLAAALGRPTWVLLSSIPLWCWLLGRSDSPWYPTARLFRQTVTGGWTGVMDDVNDALSDASRG
jgi:tetratricopeptide (TPR) repeat protein